MGHKRELLVFGLALIFFSVFLFVYRELGTSLDRLDLALLAQLREVRTPFWNRFFIELTALGSVTALTLLNLAATGILLMERRYRAGLQVALSGIFSAVSMHTVKLFVGRPRPPLEGRIDFASGFSFPSGHSTSGSAIFLTLAILAFPLLKSRTKKLVALGATSFFVSLLGFSRAYVGVHYPSDIVAGLALGSGIACLLQLFLNQRSRWHIRRKPKAGKAR